MADIPAAHGIAGLEMGVEVAIPHTCATVRPTRAETCV